MGPLKQEMVQFMLFNFAMSNYKFTFRNSKSHLGKIKIVKLNLQQTMAHHVLYIAL